MNAYFEMFRDIANKIIYKKYRVSEYILSDCIYYEFWGKSFFNLEIRLYEDYYDIQIRNHYNSKKFVIVSAEYDDINDFKRCIKNSLKIWQLFNNML